jgi:hypothetical protein
MQLPSFRMDYTVLWCACDSDQLAFSKFIQGRAERAKVTVSADSAYVRTLKVSLRASATKLKGETRIEVHEVHLACVLKKDVCTRPVIEWLNLNSGRPGKELHRAPYVGI